MVSGVKDISSARGALMARTKAKSKAASSSSRGLPGGRGGGSSDAGAKKMVQGCQPLEGAVHGQVSQREERLASFPVGVEKGEGEGCTHDLMMR